MIEAALPSRFVGRLLLMTVLMILRASPQTLACRCHIEMVRERRALAVVAAQ